MSQSTYIELPNLFQRRVAFKPFEYPEVMEFKDAIQHAYWLVSEWNFSADVQDFNTRLTLQEQEVIRRTLLAISQVEVAVKRFWGHLGDHLPKAEFEFVGGVFSDCEIRHAEAYSHLLEVLNLNSNFLELEDVPAIQGRVAYLRKHLGHATTPREYVFDLALYSLFVENISLFSQFAIIKSFNKYTNTLKDIDNVVQATQKEELLHAGFGIYLIKLLREETPEWFDDDFYRRFEDACLDAYEAELGILDWIFEEGEPEFITKYQLEQFVANRFNESLEAVGSSLTLKVDDEALSELSWFNEELFVPTESDFFHKKPVTYSKMVQAITAEDIF